VAAPGWDSSSQGICTGTRQYLCCNAEPNAHQDRALLLLLLLLLLLQSAHRALSKPLVGSGCMDRPERSTSMAGWPRPCRVLPSTRLSSLSTYTWDGGDSVCSA
jgi:hypothetical protein